MQYKRSRGIEVTKINNNNMNGTLVNNVNQYSTIPYTFIPPVIPSATVHLKTPEEYTIRHYNELIIAIMKAIDIQYITHCTNDQY